MYENNYIALFSRLIPLFFVLISTNARASTDIDDYMTLSLSELSQIPVFSVSKTTENSFKSPSAVFTLTHSDIKRSGATSIPEVLRLVPGIQVAQIDSSKWAITARGFNRQFSKKLLVMIDGRSIYNNLFSGVYWDARDVLLEDVDRIEVIRGSGSTIWGSNAVNGVINIITKEAVYTKGAMANIAIGNEEKFASYRYGGKQKRKDNNNLYYRLYVKSKENSDSKTLLKQNANDKFFINRAGFRIDLDKSNNNNNLKYNIHTSGNIYDGKHNQTYFLPSLTSLPSIEYNGDETMQGGNIIRKWEKAFSDDGNEAFLQIYFDYVKRNVSILKRQRNIIDIEFQHSLPLNNHLITWGTGYKYIKDNLKSKKINGITYLSYDPAKDEQNLFSFFVQDKYYINQDLFLILGNKFEYNDFTHLEVQPNARLSWNLTKNQVSWLAISRSVRMPNRGEDGITLLAETYQNTTILTQVGSKNFKSEKSISYEMGYRNKSLDNLTFDSSLFYTTYKNLRTQKAGTTYINDEGVTITPLNLLNDASADVYGGELSIKFDVNKKWRLIAGYSFLKMDMDLENYSDSTMAKTEGAVPKNQFNIRSQLSLPKNIKLDNTIYYVDNLPAYEIPSYIRFDSRIAWNPKRNLEISLVGQNIFDSAHPEFEKSLYSEITQVERSVYIKAKYKF